MESDSARHTSTEMQLQTQTVIDVAIENTSQPTEEHAFTPLDLSLAATGSSQDTVHFEPTPRISLNLYQSMIWCADYDIVDLQRYHYVGKTRNHMTLKRSGCIGIFIKHYLFKAVEIIECACNYIIWVKIKCNVLKGLNEDILIRGYIFVSCRF